jgi:pimeloyl-ACP methyl ester carboxylesterase
VFSTRTSIALAAALTTALPCIPLPATALQAHGSSPCIPTQGCIPAISTANIGRMGDFYVGGKWHGQGGQKVMDGSMFVEVWVPKKMLHPYPVVFVQGGGGQTLMASIQTPDGRPGWAYDFVNAGYTVYLVDPPGGGRSSYFPGVYEPLAAPRGATQMEREWSGGIAPPPQIRKVWPQWNRNTEWPGSSPNKGRAGNPVFDYYAETELQHINGYQEKLFSDALIQLLDLIGKPVVILVNSGYAPSGWVAADARPRLIRGIIAVEPWAPPIENVELGQTGPGRLWGLSNLPLHYSPPVTSPGDLHPVHLATAPGPGLFPCWVQQEPAHKLTNLLNVPVLDISGEASYHRPFAYCEAMWLNQAGVKTDYFNLEDVGLRGNGHQMMSEKNSVGISAFLLKWLSQHVH